MREKKVVVGEGSFCKGQGGSKLRVQVSSMACSDPEREKQPVCIWLVYHIPFCNDAEMQHVFPPPPGAQGALGSRAGWSCLVDLQEAPSPFSKVPDFGLMLVMVSVVVNLPSRAEWEEAGGRDDTQRSHSRCWEGGSPPDWVPPDSLQSRAQCRADSQESWDSPTKLSPFMAAVKSQPAFPQPQAFSCCSPSTHSHPSCSSSVLIPTPHPPASPRAFLPHCVPLAPFEAGGVCVLCWSVKVHPSPRR